MKEFKTIIDVRNDYEYEEGHIEGSINIPLHMVPLKIEEIKEMATPIVLCCKSGARSGNATEFLEQQGVVCFNGGGWEEANLAIENGDLCLVK